MTVLSSPSKSARYSRCVLLFTKPARPGRVKTRLIGELSPAQAAELHEAFLGDLAERLEEGAFDLVVAWALDDAEEIPSQGGVRQRGENLGDRLWNALSDMARSYEAVAAVGSDHPELAKETVERAFEKLENENADVVLGPSFDGGYYLVGSKRSSLRRGLFEGIEWSTERVMEQTAAAARGLGLDISLLPAGHDIDIPADLRALEDRLRKAPSSGRCERTEKLLNQWKNRR